MKLMHPLFSNPIAFRENCIPVLVLEIRLPSESSRSSSSAKANAVKGSLFFLKGICRLTVLRI